MNKTYARKQTQSNKGRFDMKDTNMLIEIPNGFLLIEKKGAVDEYPGIFISYSKDGKTANEIIAAIEYDTIDEIIKTITYETYSDEPTHIIKHPIETTNDEIIIKKAVKECSKFS